MLAVDILEVPVSQNNDRYLLVVIDYFTKWADAIPLCDQKATTIAYVVIKVCSSFGMPDILHSDQGRNFESTLFHQILQAFDIHKTRTTAYHPQYDGMVECFNRSLLQLLRWYVESKDDWKRYLPLVLYAYCTAQHFLTGQPTAFDPNTYSAQLQAKLALLQDFVHTNISASAQQHKLHYDKHSHVCSFVAGAPVWLSILTRGKLQPKWQGKWEVLEIKSPIDIKITNGQVTKIVHVNRLRHRKQPQHTSAPVTDIPSNTWFPPQVDHHIILDLIPPLQHRYPQHIRCPPD